MSDGLHVDDAEGRERFLREEVPAAFARLDETTEPAWGAMTPQQMVEHLLWVLEASTGRITIRSPTPDGEAARLRGFIYVDMETPRSYMNPLLTDGLPPLRFATLDEARQALLEELERFLDADPESPPRMHPLFGALDHEQWHRTHYKHVWHHLEQFGLIG